MGGKAGKVHTWNKDRLKGQLEIQSMVWPGLIFLFIFSYIPMYGSLLHLRILILCPALPEGSL